MSFYELFVLFITVWYNLIEVYIMYKISRTSLIGALITAQDNEDVNNYIWMYDLYKTNFEEVDELIDLDDLTKSQFNILVDYLIKRESYGLKTDPKSIDDLVDKKILIRKNKRKASVKSKNRSRKRLNS